MYTSNGMCIPSYGKLYHMGNANGFPSVSTTWENTSKPFVWGESGKLVTIFSPKYRCFSSIRFSFCCILCHTGNAWVSPSISHSMEKCSKTRLMRKTWDIDSHTSPKLWVLLFHQISMLWYTTSWIVHGCSHEFPVVWVNLAKRVHHTERI